MKKSTVLIKETQFIARSLSKMVSSVLLAYMFTFSGCSSSGEDDASLEATEPVEATPQETKDATTQAAGEPTTPTDLPTAEAPSPEAPVPAEPTSPQSAPVVSDKQTEAQGSGTMINTSKRVLYVKVEKAVLREQPTATSKVIGKATRGEHFLVTIEGDWAKTEDGKYISMKVLSERGVGRQKKSADWGQPGDVAPKKKRAKANKPAKKTEPVVDGVPAASEKTSPEEASPAAGSDQSGTPSTEKN